MKSYKILIVEDDVFLIQSLKETLEDFGCHITTTHDGTEAIKKLSQETFDLIISDIKMPKMDGISLLDALKKMDICIPVVMMTGYSEYNDDQIQNRGGVVLLEKPFNRAKIKELFDNYISLLPTGSD